MAVTGDEAVWGVAEERPEKAGSHSTLTPP